MSMDWFEKFEKAEDLVEAVLKNVPEARENDMALLAVVWQMQGLKLTPEQFKQMKRCLPAETITRARRKIQQEGKYMPNKHKYEQRKLLEEEVRRYI